MKQAIIKINEPKHPNPTQSDGLRTLRSATENNRTIENVLQLGKYSWLIPLKSQLPFLSHVVSVASQTGLSYQVAFFDQDLEWNNYVCNDNRLGE